MQISTNPIRGIMRRLRNCTLGAASLICALAISQVPLGAQVLPDVATSFNARPMVSPTRLTGPTPTVNPHPGLRLWQVSLAALATSNAMDIHSSWKKRELNPLLSPSSGQFGWQSALVKAGISGAVLGVEYLVTRHNRHSGLYRMLSITNFTAAAAVGAVAAHNSALPAPSR